jgi:hypothetical protein
MTLKAVDSTSPLEGGVNQHSSFESRVSALLQLFAEESQKEISHEEASQVSHESLMLARSIVEMSESQKRAFLRCLIKLTNRWRDEPDWSYDFCFTCAYYKGKGRCRAGCSPREANKRKQCGTWRVL